MIYLLMISFALFPLAAGITTIYILGKTKLSKLLFLFFIFTSFWQIDVSFLYAREFFSNSVIEFLFKLFRFGSIMLAPTLFSVIYTAINQTQMVESRMVKYAVNKFTVVILYIWSTFVYLIGWSHKGIQSFELVKPQGLIKVSFLYPVYGDLSWIFNFNLLIFIIITVLSLALSKNLKDSETKTFVHYFIIIATVGYCIGILNMIKSYLLLPSSIAVLFLSIGILIPVIRMHQKIIAKMNNALLDQKEFLHKIIDMNPSYIYAKSQDGKYTLTNQAYGLLFGVNSEELIGNFEMDYNPDLDMAKQNISLDHQVLSTLVEKHIPENEIIDSQGNKRWIQTVKLPIISTGDKQVLSVATDITQRKINEKKREWEALHDPLTGLPNRRAFHQDLIERIKLAKLNQESIAVIFLDLDRFKIINDTLNHENGDLLLKKVAERLSKADDKRVTDFSVYRLGGDEFTFILFSVTKDETTLFVKRLLNIFKKSFTLKDHELFVTSSLGISMYPTDGDHPDVLIKNADIAMYSSKESGRNSYSFFTQEMNDDYQKKMVLEKALRKALHSNELKIVYQPKMDIETNSIIGMEALLRWESSELGMISPAEFIPLAEETGIILPLGEWVLKSACIQNKIWQDMGYTPISVSVNISMRQFYDGNFVESVINILEETKLDAQYLDLEITESISMANIDSVISTLNELRAMGISISIDDFGTGYSSLSYLKKFPINNLKIDRSFVRDITSNSENRAIVKTIISMANNLNLDVIAEGVETEEELKFLKANGCIIVQGYLFSPPITDEEFERSFLEQHNEPATTLI
ncbi:PAS domain S-box protein [Bacillus sp. AFS076308]|uniref:putative bifunctional diguanylate cyclase/phosphodiesterase n=1 Tax=unclassified Bacillus (in: firmicutes) TaxID=185979 RepID=UPI000BF771FF|nr:MULTISPECIES: bifunctional diguanylate cyclase/phosphodiesterase [unclassified Bacillus (in: firmicutes)]PFO03314.1 PAS domain S-box protein [Bacillus sp. AFS076308]PGV48596.1 PAS domain S-box protein [Bacillus sp. AFS037270]